MPKLELVSDQDFWSGTYAGRRIAIFNEHGRWHASLDHAHQPNLVFTSAEHAVKWLTRRVAEATFACAA